MYKHPTDLKFCTSCGVGNHSLENCPIMLDKINKKKNVNVLSYVQKSDVICTKNLQIVTIQGTKTGNDNPRISKIKSKNDYPNPIKQKQLYNDASNMFQEFARHEEVKYTWQDISQELLNLTHNDKLVAQFIDPLCNIKNKTSMNKQTKNICSLNKKSKDDYPDSIKQKQLYNKASNMFQEFAWQEEVIDSRQDIS